jgi:hypothetical protein
MADPSRASYHGRTKCISQGEVMAPVIATSRTPRALPQTHALVAACCPAMLLATLMTASPVRAQSQTEACNGLDFDVSKPVIVAKVVSSAPKIHYVKSASENASCPAETEKCRTEAYLAPGELVLANRLRAPYTCVTYQSPQDTRQIWTNALFPSASLAPVAPLPAPRPADWVGTWSHAGGEIRIEPGANGKLAILGFQAYPGALNEHTGAMQAAVTPSGATLAFADDGSKPFGKNDDDCQVRMQRVDALLVVEDNGVCGSVAVTFTGLYRRKP